MSKRYVFVDRFWQAVTRRTSNGWYVPTETREPRYLYFDSIAELTLPG